MFKSLSFWPITSKLPAMKSLNIQTSVQLCVHMKACHKTEPPSNHPFDILKALFLILGQVFVVRLLQVTFLFKNT